MAMKTKQCKMTQRQIDFIQKHADRLEVTWSEGLRRILDTIIDNYEITPAPKKTSLIRNS